MEQPNWWLIPAVALIPLVVGSIWYNPKVFGNAWMRTAEISEERASSGNMAKILGLSYLFCLFGAYILSTTAVHQSAVMQLFFGDPAMNDPASSISVFLNDFMNTYGSRHRTFGHGLIHGMELALMLGLCLIGVNSMFERRPFKYVIIHVGFWMLSFGLMGGLLCQYF
jgi:hypothetical protein